jgi:hypothetical protein
MRIKTVQCKPPPAPPMGKWGNAERDTVEIYRRYAKVPVTRFLRPSHIDDGIFFQGIFGYLFG